MYFAGVNPVSAFLKDPEFARYFFITSGIRVAHMKVLRRPLLLKRYASKKVLSLDDANEVLKENILRGRPFFYGRYGSSEISFAAEIIMKRKKIKKNLDEEVLISRCNNCGLFPATVDTFERFADLLLESSAYVDMQGLGRMVLEDYFIKKHVKDDVILTRMCMTDFWLHEKPFTMALKNKKVLVIHPYESLIRKQYEKRKLLFRNDEVLPQFELITLKAVQTIAGQKDERFESWFDALEYMYQKAIAMEFDIALIGCGAYGYPLAAKLKKAGKIAIHMGGVTQVLFGIKGSRWDADPNASKLYNEHWVRPGKEDTPQRAYEIEDGCYW